jgi:uncharacterized protein YkwD
MPLRPRSLLAPLLFVTALAALIPTLAHPARYSPTRSAAATLDLGILSQLNGIRSAHGLRPLTVSRSLGAAAMAHSRDMVAAGYFAHDSSGGQPFWQRIQAFYTAGSYGYWAVGENLFWSAGLATADACVEAWMASPKHRANILDPNWTQIGIAAVTPAAAPGTYEKSDVTVVTTDFGARE